MWYELSGSIQCVEFSWLADNRLASQEGLCCVERISKYYNFRQGAVRFVPRYSRLSLAFPNSFE